MIIDNSSSSNTCTHVDGTNSVIRETGVIAQNTDIRQFLQAIGILATSNFITIKSTERGRGREGEREREEGREREGERERERER